MADFAKMSQQELLENTEKAVSAFMYRSRQEHVVGRVVETPQYRSIDYDFVTSIMYEDCKKFTSLNLLQYCVVFFSHLLLENKRTRID